MREKKKVKKTNPNLGLITIVLKILAVVTSGLP